MHRDYELLVILNYEILEEDIDNKVDKIKEVITKQGGEVNNVNKWGKRRLAYEIKKSKKGFYLLIQFTCEPQEVRHIEQNLKFLEGVERFMTVIISEKSGPNIYGTDLEMTEEAV